ncbi:hypothetical protein VCRA2110O2_30137 [Vibrio crassostreae]|nr:hypothetical protein VCHA44O286_50238 [Vibrio chagasii]CAK2853050.1 hypothetical protein VCRA2110O2_30137 [Vibrio crassostreae]
MGRVTLNTNCGVTPMNNYLLIGRVCDCDNEVKIVTATIQKLPKMLLKSI